MMIRRTFILAAMLALVASLATVSGKTPAQAEQSFEQLVADEALTSRHADALRLYWAFFDRQPDTSGASYWTQRIDACATLEGITWSFANSTEFVNTYGDLSDEEFIDLIYGNVLDRAPDAKGGAYWSERLADGRLTRAKAMLYFSLSDEFRNRHPLPSDDVPDKPCATSTTGSPAVTTTTQAAGCHQAYTPCLPITDDLNCSDIDGSVTIIDPRVDPYRLDADNDGYACENS